MGISIKKYLQTQTIWILINSGNSQFSTKNIPTCGPCVTFYTDYRALSSCLKLQMLCVMCQMPRVSFDFFYYKYDTFLDKGVKLVGGGSVINGAYLV